MLSCPKPIRTELSRRPIILPMIMPHQSEKVQVNMQKLLGSSWECVLNTERILFLTQVYPSTIMTIHRLSECELPWDRFRQYYYKVALLLELTSCRPYKPRDWRCHGAHSSAASSSCWRPSSLLGEERINFSRRKTAAPLSRSERQTL